MTDLEHKLLKAQSTIHACKRVCFRLWKRVEDKLDNARSAVGDNALSLRDAIWGSQTNSEKQFWKEYDEWKMNS